MIPRSQSCEQREQFPGIRDQGDGEEGYQELILRCMKGIEDGEALFWVSAPESVRGDEL